MKTVEFLQYGENLIETWYYSPIPKEYHGKFLYACSFCLNFFKEKNELEEHSEKCTIRAPPGDEIYRDDKLAMFEVDGRT
jgi:hypothetical protein